MSGRRLVIFGVGDFARVAARYFMLDSEYEVLGFTVHERHLPESRSLLGLPVLPFESLSETHPPQMTQVFVGVGYSRVNRARAEVVAECRSRGYTLASYLCSRAIVMDPGPLKENTFIFEANVIQPFVTIGENVILWSGNHVGHDSTIGDHVFIASHAVISGNCTVGSHTFIGVNATVRDGVTIAPHCVIGASAVVMRDTKEGDVLAVPNTPLFRMRSWELRM